ncbi:hypothetical protein X773_01190 [Mesorhizobium sp. LSJC285A00]|uniref:DUF1376 domain-containing protein n=1 Tax=Mesorhizobium sp. LSJC285A00 TaxID=1287338 RepID=UPI0003CF413E|nr:DUF1376 domain-containing protein [Mesorhizobium sp. LSJC285A00]ESW91721.1 hypothetical protein X773_01190 [Mesorhizobium sp. LSJC285A00]
MTDLAWMKTYIGTETALTAHLTAEEFGAYERLRRHYWQHGSMPSDDARLVRISGIDPERWEAVAQAIGPLMSEGLQRLDAERSDATIKREKKVAAGHRGAEARWRINGKTNALANGTTMADASEEMAEPSVCQWPSASASASDSSALDEKEEGLEPARAKPNVLTMSMAEARAHLEKEGKLENSYAAAKGITA